MSGRHTLYYSMRCRHCQAFLEELSRTPFRSEFQFFCVDPSPSRPPLPAWLKSVPSLAVAGKTQPLIGPGPVNNWLFERKLGGSAQKTSSQAMEERNVPLAPPVYNPELAPRPDATGRMATPSAPMSASAPAPGPASASAPAEDGPLAYHNTEMGGSKWTDNYSFLSIPEGACDKIYNPIIRNFECLVNVNPMTGSGGPAPKSVAKPSAKEEALLREFEAFSAARDRDIPGPPQRR